MARFVDHTHKKIINQICIQLFQALLCGIVCTYYYYWGEGGGKGGTVLSNRGASWTPPHNNTYTHDPHMITLHAHCTTAGVQDCLWQVHISHGIANCNNTYTYDLTDASIVLHHFKVRDWREHAIVLICGSYLWSTMSTNHSTVYTSYCGLGFHNYRLRNRWVASNSWCTGLFVRVHIFDLSCWQVW